VQQNNETEISRHSGEPFCEKNYVSITIFICIMCIVYFTLRIYIISLNYMKILNRTIFCRNVIRLKTGFCPGVGQNRRAGVSCRQRRGAVRPGTVWWPARRGQLVVAHLVLAAPGGGNSCARHRQQPLGGVPDRAVDGAGQHGASGCRGHQQCIWSLMVAYLISTMFGRFTCRPATMYLESGHIISANIVDEQLIMVNLCS
jgi:hypothetical protein